MNRITLITRLVIANLLITAPVLASGNIAGAAQKGSLLIFPRIEARAPSNSASGITDTLISISNDYDKPVNLQCYWNTTEQHGDVGKVGLGGNAAANKIAKAARIALRNNHYMAFSFVLPKNTPTAFWAGDLSKAANKIYQLPSGIKKLATVQNVPQFNDFQDGTQANTGELRCWAANYNGTKEIHHNHLRGQATIFTFKADTTASVPIAAGQAHEYNAWVFQAYLQGSADIKHTSRPLGTPGQLDLDGKEYDQCPTALTGQFIPSGQNFGFGKSRTHISLANCNHDLREDSDAHITSLSYTVYNTAGVKFSGAHECMGAWYEADVSATFPNFTYRTLKSDSARFVIRPSSSKSCNQGSQAAAPEKDITSSGIVGVQVNDIGGQYQSSSNLIGLTNTVNTVNPLMDKILWDPS